MRGCVPCTDAHTKDAQHAGDSPARLNLVAAWRESTVFTDAERAALELAEQGTRIADAAAGVSVRARPPARLTLRQPDLLGFCHMGHLVSRRRKIVAPIVLSLAAALIALTVAAWPSSAHAGGDPGGRLMAKIAPVVRVVPGFERSRIPWIASPCDSCKFPVTYALKVGPRWDSCDGMTGTFGWDPVVIQIGFRWTGGSQALVNLLNERLAARGWTRGAVPSWADDDDPTVWIRPHGLAPAEAFTLDRPMGNRQWMAEVEAKPQGQLASGC